MRRTASRAPAGHSQWLERPIGAPLTHLQLGFSCSMLDKAGAGIFLTQLYNLVAKGPNEAFAGARAVVAQLKLAPLGCLASWLTLHQGILVGSCVGILVVAKMTTLALGD